LGRRFWCGKKREKKKKKVFPGKTCMETLGRIFHGRDTSKKKVTLRGTIVTCLCFKGRNEGGLAGREGIYQEQDPPKKHRDNKRQAHAGNGYWKKPTKKGNICCSVRGARKKEKGGTKKKKHKERWGGVPPGVRQRDGGKRPE